MNKKKDSSKIVSTYREVFKVGQCDYIIRLTFFGVEIGPSPPIVFQLICLVKKGRLQSLPKTSLGLNEWAFDRSVVEAMIADLLQLLSNKTFTN